MQRKEFIKACGLQCLGGLAMVSMLSSCAGNYYAVTKLDSNKLVIDKKEFIEIKKGVSKERKYVLTRIERLHFPICLYKLNENTYSALYMECTHNSCELNPNGNFLICPCHGSEFDRLGIVQNPPAEENLHNFKVTHDDEKIYIHLA